MNNIIEKQCGESSHTGLEQLLPLANIIAGRLSRRYSWIAYDDLKGYSFLGLLLAYKAYDPNRGVSFREFAIVKALYLAVDEMRHDKVLFRGENDFIAKKGIDAETVDAPDPYSGKGCSDFESKDYCKHLIDGLKGEQRELLAMIYTDRMKYSEISSLLGITEAAVCQRHNKLLSTLRRKASLSIV